LPLVLFGPQDTVTFIRFFTSEREGGNATQQLLAKFRFHACLRFAGLGSFGRKRTGTGSAGEIRYHSGARPQPRDARLINKAAAGIIP
jgi:hypothetical protein